MIVGGVLVVVAAWLLHRSRAGRLATLPVAGVAAIATARLAPRVLRPVHVLLGGVALAFLLGYTVLGEVGLFDRLGEGGVERWIVYPVLLWLVVAGAALAAVQPSTTAG